MIDIAAVMRVTAVSVMAIALGACAVSKSSGPPTPVCNGPAVAMAPQILYPEDNALGVSVDVGEILYAESSVLRPRGTLYLQGVRAIAVKPRGDAPKPYPNPIATPFPFAGPIQYATFGKLAPATRYVVKFKQPKSSLPCGVLSPFTPTSFTTK